MQEVSYSLLRLRFFNRILRLQLFLFRGVLLVFVLSLQLVLEILFSLQKQQCLLVLAQLKLGQFGGGTLKGSRVLAFGHSLVLGVRCSLHLLLMQRLMEGSFGLGEDFLGRIDGHLEAENVSLEPRDFNVLDFSSEILGLLENEVFLLLDFLDSLLLFPLLSNDLLLLELHFVVGLLNLVYFVEVVQLGESDLYFLLLLLFLPEHLEGLLLFFVLQIRLLNLLPELGVGQLHFLQLFLLLFEVFDVLLFHVLLLQLLHLLHSLLRLLNLGLNGLVFLVQQLLVSLQDFLYFLLSLLLLLLHGLVSFLLLFFVLSLQLLQSPLLFLLRPLDLLFLLLLVFLPFLLLLLQLLLLFLYFLLPLLILQLVFFLHLLHLLLYFVPLGLHLFAQIFLMFDQLLLLEFLFCLLLLLALLVLHSPRLFLFPQLLFQLLLFDLLLQGSFLSQFFLHFLILLVLLFSLFLLLLQLLLLLLGLLQHFHLPFLFLHLL